MTDQEKPRLEQELARALEESRGKEGFWFVGNSDDAAREIAKALRHKED